MSDDIPVGQLESLRGRPGSKTDEEIAYCPSTFNNLPSSNERINGEAEQNSGEHAQGILLEIHERLGQISATNGRDVQQHAALNDRDQSFHDVDWQERAMPLTFFYPEYEEKKTSPQAYVKEAVIRQQDLNELCRRNTAQAQMRQRKKYHEKNTSGKIVCCRTIRLGVPD